MTVGLNGRRLARDDVVRVAREGVAVAFDRAAAAAMADTHGIVVEAATAGQPVYGVTTAVGVLKRVAVTEREGAAYSRRMIAHHLVAQGEPGPRDVVRAAMLRLADAVRLRATRGGPGPAQRP